MSYQRAEHVLPPEVLALVQKYAEGCLLYVPKRENERNTWGTINGTKAYYASRNAAICAEARNGTPVSELAERYFLTTKSIQRILRKGERNMRSDNYKEYFTSEYLMGPCSLRILDELLETCPLPCTAESKILDLGCGTGITSLFLAKETGAEVTGLDLWISAEANAKRAEQWGVKDRFLPVHGDANAMPFAPETFDAVVSVDAYHYFGTPEDFFGEKILPVIKEGGAVLIGIPGIRNEFDGRSSELMADWLGDEAYMFQSAESWKKIIGSHPDIAEVKTWELACFDQAWQDWFDTKHEYAMGDLALFDSIIKPYSCFVGIWVKKK